MQNLRDTHINSTYTCLIFSSSNILQVIGYKTHQVTGIIESILLDKVYNIN